MIRLSVMYPASSSPFDWDYYLGSHHQLCHTLLDPLGMVKMEIDRGVAGFPPGAPPPFRAIAHLFFPTMETFYTALGTVGPQLMADQMNYCDGKCSLQISEVV